MKEIVKVWTFESSSSNNTYETLLYTDGSTSCNCPGWTRRSQRTCKHTRAVDMGLADNQCIACHDYQSEKKPSVSLPEKQPVIKKEPVKEKQNKPVVRKIRWK